MTSAKPHSMAAQTDAPDDLIAELAKLMADDAHGDRPAANETAKDRPSPIRIPGSGEPAPVAPSTPAAAIPAIRIPGEQPEAKKAEPAEPFRFDFDLGLTDKPAAPVMPAIPSREPPRAAAPRVVEPEAESAPLDHDGLADLIAAELANDLTGVEPTGAPEAPERGEDNFGVPPVFGLDAPAAPADPQPSPVRPAPVAEAPIENPEEFAQSMLLTVAAEPKPEVGESDPLADIERLVGPAVQLKNDEPPAPPVVPSPALRSLATPTLPRADQRTEPGFNMPPQSEPSSVDEAILAAAAATGARVEWVDDGESDLAVDAEDDVVPPRARRSMPRVNRAVLGPLVAIALLGVAGIGLYWVLGQGGAPSGPAPLLVADTAPVKDVPEAAPVQTQQSVVFNEISGTDTSAVEQIVPRDQADEAAISEATTPSVTGGVLDAGDGNAIDPNQDGLVNRKVRTVTVRPDGTIISGNDSLAGGSILPVDRPNVPDVPGADFSTPELIANANASAATETAAAPEPEATVTPNVPVAEPGTDVPVVDAAGAALQGRTVRVPMQRPADFAQAAASALAAVAQQPASSAGALTAPAAQQPAATTQTAAPPAGNAAAYVQLSSQRSEEAAQQTAQAISTRYGVLFNGVAPQIQRVDLGERGIYYRVLVPAASREAAANICTNVRAAGGDCLLL